MIGMGSTLECPVLRLFYSELCVLTNMLVDVKPTDPVTFVCVAMISLFIPGIASWLPGLRAPD